MNTNVPTPSKRLMKTLMESMTRGAPVSAARGAARHLVDEATWLSLSHALARGEGDLVSLWSDGSDVHMAIFDPANARIGVVSRNCPDGRYPSVAHLHPPASRFERTIADLYGIVAHGAPDARRWLDHGRWGRRHPLSAAPEERPANPADPYAFLPVDGEGLHQIPVGPVHAGIIEPGHFRFTANGETVVRLEERLGYVHKGVEGLMRGAPLAQAARLAGRVSGDSTVAYALAFAQASEAALEVAIPERAVFLRALMAELERLANHFGDIGAICNDAAFSMMHAHTGVVREKILRTAHTCFGHRLMMDRVVPGGVATDIAPDGEGAIQTLLDSTSRLLPRLIALYGDTTALQDRTVGAGRLSPELARQFAAGGYVGRASGRVFDARRTPAYAPYDLLSFDLGASQEGDVDARVWVRFDEVQESLNLIAQILDRLPAGELRRETPPAGEAREGLALVEGFRGDIFVWLRIGPDGAVAHCHLRDPSWLQWPLLEAAIEGNIVADFPLCNKSFNCSYSGPDL